MLPGWSRFSQCCPPAPAINASSAPHIVDCPTYA
jgi:hypothetical protein